jgi:hypothetical protein
MYSPDCGQSFLRLDLDWESSAADENAHSGPTTPDDLNIFDCKEIPAFSRVHDLWPRLGMSVSARLNGVEVSNSSVRLTTYLAYTIAYTVVSRSGIADQYTANPSIYRPTRVILTTIGLSPLLLPSASRKWALIV